MTKIVWKNKWNIGSSLNFKSLADSRQKVPISDFLASEKLLINQKNTLHLIFPIFRRHISYLYSQFFFIPISEFRFPVFDFSILETDATPSRQLLGSFPFYDSKTPITMWGGGGVWQTLWPLSTSIFPPFPLTPHCHWSCKIPAVLFEIQCSISKINRIFDFTIKLLNIFKGCAVGGGGAIIAKFVCYKSVYILSKPNATF